MLESRVKKKRTTPGEREARGEEIDHSELVKRLGRSRDTSLPLLRQNSLGQGRWGWVSLYQRERVVHLYALPYQRISIAENRFRSAAARKRGKLKQ